MGGLLFRDVREVLANGCTDTVESISRGGRVMVAFEDEGEQQLGVEMTGRVVDLTVEVATSEVVEKPVEPKESMPWAIRWLPVEPAA